MKTSALALATALAAALVALTATPAAAAAGPITLSDPQPFYNTPFTVTSSCDPGEAYVVQLRYTIGGPAYQNLEGVADATTGAISQAALVPWSGDFSTPGNPLDVRVFCSPDLTDPYYPVVADPNDQAELSTTFGDALLPITVTGDPYPGADLAVSGSGCSAGESVLLRSWATMSGEYVDRVITADGAGAFAAEPLGIDPGILPGAGIGVGYFCGGTYTGEPWHYARTFLTVLAAPAPPAPPAAPSAPDLPSAAIEELAETGPVTTEALPLALVLLFGGAVALTAGRRLRWVGVRPERVARAR
jgi:hypothetical protein